MSKNEMVRCCLREGPTTAPEVAAATGLTQKNACARLRRMEESRQVRRIGTVPSRNAGRPAVLFQATRRLRPPQTEEPKQ